MRQILQSLRTGETHVADVPAPAIQKGRVLIATSRSLISAGTERMLVEFGQAGWVAKARQHPDRVRAVLGKMSTDGVIPTFEAVLNRLDQPLPLGYCNVGVALESTPGASEFRAGDRVASNGHHAEVVSVPTNLCVKVPDGVTDDEAAFTVVAAIGLQGVRLAQPTLGEYVVVIGLGLIGLITVQLLQAHGCHVLGFDYDSDRVALARSFGAQAVDLSAGDMSVSSALAFSRGRGVDAVIITASTSSSEPVHQAALMSRKRGRVVLVGVTGLELSRADFYDKELTLQVSCSYGPGRYDAAYEERGLDYPVAFVRWTAQRNFEAVLEMMAERRLDVRPLISHRFAIADARLAYEIVTSKQPSLGILLEYPEPAELGKAKISDRTVRVVEQGPSASGPVALGFIGAGQHSTAALIPAFKATHARLRSVASSGGVSGLYAAKQFGFELTTTDTTSLLNDPQIGAVVITTRHDSHAELACAALRAGKHVFVEKPLALSADELAQVVETYAELARTPRILMVGFNRRFAPHIVKIRQLLAGVSESKAFVMTVNAGFIRADHWTQDPERGGGRIIGEACHFIDLLRFLAGAQISTYAITRIDTALGDTASIQLSFGDGSIGTIHYFANGSRRFPKERLEVFAGGGVLQLDNFRRLAGFGWPGFTSMKLWRQDKGHRSCAAAFVDAIARGGPAPIPFDELLEISRVSLALEKNDWAS